MTYTAEQLREMASLIKEQEVPTDGQQIKMLRALAAALEELAAHRAENEVLKDANAHWHVRVQQVLSDKESAQDAQAGAERAKAKALSQRDALWKELGLTKERAERAEAELAKLRQHAEAMAEGIESSHLEIEQEALAAYRADFPEEKP